MNFISFEQVDKITIPEYKLLMKAAELKMIDKSYLIHIQAFETLRVKATKGKKGKLVYKRFKDFFNYEEEINKVMNKNRENNLDRYKKFLQRKGE